MSDHKLKSHSDKSIAVLPFVNMSKDPENEYFSDGITEEIINALTTIQGLKVIARTSSFAFKNKNIDIRIIGNQLGVSTILEGSVRKANNRVRITAQLIDTIDGTHLWSKNFDRELEDIFALQDEVSLLIADQIRENFGHFEIPPILQTVPTKNIEAYNLWLKGSYHLKRKDFDDIKKAITFFREAIQLDPNYATAYSFLGEAYIHAAGFGMMSTKEAHELARTSVEKAIAIDIKQAQAYKVLAFIQLFYDWEWKSAIEAYDKAITYGLPDQNEFISYYYIFIKEDFEKAIQVALRATETDPLHVITHWQLGLTYYFARRFEASILAFSKALEIDPNFGEALRFRGLVKGCSGQYNEALIDIQKALGFSNGQGPANLDMLMVKILMGKKKEALSIIQKTDYIDSSDPASLYALLQMPDEAIHWLEKAYQERSVMLVTLKNFWFWDNIREDTRFQEIYKRMKFPESIKNKEQLESISIRPIAPNNSALLSEKEIDLHLEQLGRLISEEIYTDPSLSLRKLAERIDLHSNKLSWLINEHIGKNFNEYINAFRLQKFKENALNPRNSHLTLLALAYESGFNSKTAFNAFFKKMEGTTPRNWVKKHTQ